MSQQHFRLVCQGLSLKVERLEKASNPLYFKGESQERFAIQGGEHFVVGETRFQVLVKEMQESPSSAQEFTLAHDARQRLQEHRAAECLQALTRLLPALREAAELEELWEAALEILKGLLPSATRIFPLEVYPDGSYSHQLYARDLHYAPSKRLLQLAFETGQTAIHQWGNTAEQDMTVVAGVEWALATPITVSDKERYALYALGSNDPQTSDQERALIDLVGEALGHFLAARRADRIRAQVGQFFSPSLRDLIDKQGMGHLMEPVRRTVSVLFFDLRGFSKATEKAEDEALDKVLEHHALLTEVMTLATRCIFDHEGIVLDYAGDAIMAGWGAPQDLKDHATRAVSAAIDIVTTIQSMDLPFESEGGLRCGLGLGCGEVVAGQTGGRDQIKYGWMGRVVNMAARLEGLTKYFSVPILMTGPLRDLLGEREDLRRIGQARPAGMDETVEIYEVVMPRELGGSGLSPEEIKSYEAAERQYAKGDMLETIKALRLVPVEDPVARFLTRQAYHYEDAGLPQPWTGVIEFLKK